MERFYEGLRIFNAVAALGGLYLAWRMASEHWAEYAPRARWITVSYLGLLMSIVYGSLDQALRGTMGSPRVIVVALAIMPTYIAWFASTEMFKGEK